MVGDDSIANSEWLSYISEVRGELHSEVSLLLPQLFETSSSISATGATSYSEPATHARTVRVAEILDDGTERPLRELQPFEEVAYRGRTGTAIGWLHAGDQLFLCPVPSTGTYKWYFQAQSEDLSSLADDDPIDVYCPAGEAFLIWGVAVLAKAKGGKDVTLAMAQRERAREQLQVWAANHSLLEVRTRGPVDGYDEGPTDPAEWWPYR